MPTQKKAEAPDYYWINWREELQARVTPEDERYDQYAALMQSARSLEFVNVTTFCAGTQPVFFPLVFDDFASGEYVDKLKTAVRQWIYCEFCEEV